MPNTPFGYIIPAGAQFNTLTNPVAPASTSAYKMQGLGYLLTPVTPSPKILADISFTLITTTGTAGTGINMQLWYGPMVNGVAAPANAAAIPASAIQLGTTTTHEVGTAITTVADYFLPVDIQGLAVGLTPGQQYWFDLACESIGTASAFALTSVNGCIVEIG